MAFRNFDSYYLDYDYDSDPSPSPVFHRSGSPLPSRTPRRRENSSPRRSTRPIIGDDGWEVLPAELLDPSNWGLPPSSLSNTPQKPDHRTDQEPKMYPGGTSRIFPGNNMEGGVMQFYPDYDPHLINTNQLDGMPYVLQSSNIPSTIHTAPKVVVNAAYNASGGPKKMSLSQRWEQGLLEIAHSNPETLRNYSRIPPGKRGGFKSFGELRDDDEGGRGGVGSSGGTVLGPNFAAFGPSRGRGQMPASTLGHSSGLPGQPLTSGDGGGSTPGFTFGGSGRSPSSGQPLGGSVDGCGRGNSLPTTHETPRTLGGGSASIASSKAAARDAALRRDAATKVEQMRNKAELKRKEYMKEIRQTEKAAAKKAKLEEQKAEKERVKLEKLEKDREARSRKEREWEKKGRDVRSLAAEAAARRDAASKDIQRKRAESQRERREREESEKEKRASARAQKKREGEEQFRLVTEKRQRDVEAWNTKPREVEVKSKDARQLVSEASERRLAAMERREEAEERSKPAPATKVTAKAARANTMVCEDCGKRFASEAQAFVHGDKSGHQNFAEIKPGAFKPFAKSSLAPAPGEKATPAPTATSAKTAAKAPEKNSPPYRPAPAKAPTPEPTETYEEKLTPR